MAIQPTLAILLLFVTIATAAVRAQEFDGQISGVVVNASGSPVPGQRVELVLPRAKGGRLVATTDENGAFRFSGLAVDHYRVELIVDGRPVSKSDQIGLSAPTSEVASVTLAVPPAKVHKERSELARLFEITYAEVDAALASDLPLTYFVPVRTLPHDTPQDALNAAATLPGVFVRNEELRVYTLGEPAAHVDVQRGLPPQGARLHPVRRRTGVRGVRPHDGGGPPHRRPVDVEPADPW